MALEFDYIQSRLEQEFPEKIQWEDSKDMPSGILESTLNEAVIRFLFEEEDLAFRFITDITAVHFPERKGEEICVVYHLHQLDANIRIRLKCFLPIENPAINSVVEIFNGANWMERETYDYYGVIFLNHPNLKRILNVEEMDYFPMRKEYPMEDATRMDKDDEMFGRGGEDLY